VRPSARRKGYATKMLGMLTVKLKDLAYDRVLLTCDEDNIGSIRTIEHCGGKLSDKVLFEGTWTRRYWIHIKLGREAVRKATKDDLCGILTLYGYLFPEENFSDSALFLPTWEEILKHDGLIYFVAIQEDEIVATCNLSVIPNLSQGRRPFALIENVVTRPDVRRRGFGRRVAH
jgi:hypothetical protein